MDREKVIKGLNDIGGFIAGRNGFEQARNFLRTIDDALALIDTQYKLILERLYILLTESHMEHICFLRRELIL